MTMMQFSAVAQERDGLWRRGDTVELYLPGHGLFVNGTPQRVRYGRIMAAYLVGHLRLQPLRQIPLAARQSVS